MLKYLQNCFEQVNWGLSLTDSYISRDYPFRGIVKAAPV